MCKVFRRCLSVDSGHEGPAHSFLLNHYDSRWHFGKVEPVDSDCGRASRTRVFHLPVETQRVRGNCMIPGAHLYLVVKRCSRYVVNISCAHGSRICVGGRWRPSLMAFRLHYTKARSSWWTRIYFLNYIFHFPPENVPR